MTELLCWQKKEKKISQGQLVQCSVASQKFGNDRICLEDWVSTATLGNAKL